MSWWGWLLVAVLGPSALIAVVLVPLLAVELVKARRATADRRHRPRAAAAEQPTEDRSERVHDETRAADQSRNDHPVAPS